MDVQAELGEPSHPLRNVPVAEIDGLEMPFELMPPSVASVVRSHLSEGLSTERPETWARVEASDDGQNGGELGIGSSAQSRAQFWDNFGFYAPLICMGAIYLYDWYSRYAPSHLYEGII